MNENDELLSNQGGKWWDEFFADRAKACPFFVEWPDENLVEWVETGLLNPGHALELGCGNGRNALFLARSSFDVDGVDVSVTAIKWAEEQAAKADRKAKFRCSSIFDVEFEEGSYDLVYDSGCFHHVAPHQRSEYIELVARALKPGGHYGLVCFRPEGGSGYTDAQVYENRSLGGGLGYSENQLRSLWDGKDFSIGVLRQMRKPETQESLFGEDFLWAMLAKKNSI